MRIQACIHKHARSVAYGWTDSQECCSARCCVAKAALAAGVGMDGEQHFGTKTTFGPQVLSNRPSSPITKFGSGKRTAKIHDKAWESQLLGLTSPGPTTAVKSGLGVQANSRCASAPAHRISTALSHHAVKGPSIGPGHYNAPCNTIGTQPLESQRPRSPAFKLGSSPRWCEFKGGLTGEPVQPMLVSTKLPAGYLGDAPAWSFHGPKERRPVTAGAAQHMGCPLPPTSTAAPGPAAYATELSSFGCQVNSASSPVVSIPKATRDKLLCQTLPRGQEHVRTSPGPCCPQMSSLGRQVVSRARSASGVKFGSSDRFSDTKPYITVQKRTASSNGTSSDGASGNGASNNGSNSGSSTQRPKASSGGKNTLAAPREVWPYNTPGPGAYVV